MKNLTTLLLLTTSTYAMDMGQPAGVGAAAVHAGAQAPVAAPFIDWMAAGYVPEAPALVVGLAPYDQRALFMKRFHDILHRRNRDEMMALITDAVAHSPNIMNDFLNEAIRLNDPSLRHYILREITGNLDRMDAPTRLQTYITLGNIFKALQSPIAYGLALGDYGIEQYGAELRSRAEAGWVGAQDVYAGGLAEGWHGIGQDRAELRRLAYVEGWVGAQELYAQGLALGWYGIEQDHAELICLAYEKEWIGAQRVYAGGLAKGAYGIQQDHAELRSRADAGWVGAQRVYAEGLASGCYGIRLDRATLRALAIQNIMNNSSPYVTRYLGTLPTLQEKIQFMVDAWNHAEVPAPAVATLPAVVAPDRVPAELPASRSCSVM